MQVGYALPDSLSTKPISATSDGSANSYVDKAFLTESYRLQCPILDSLETICKHSKPTRRGVVSRSDVAHGESRGIVGIVREVNAQLESAAQKLRDARLKAFVQAF